jgi:uncharacterized membrane protein YgdD (TMEM256/DUF423 family)
MVNGMTDQAFFLRVACVLGAVGVAAGAFGAHGLKARLSADMLEIFEVGVRYQMYHALAMLAVSAAAAVWASPWAARACWAWLAGVAVFSGSLYVLATTGLRWLGMITPIGGVAFIAGWVMLFMAGSSLLTKP